MKKVPFRYFLFIGALLSYAHAADLRIIVKKAGRTLEVYENDKRLHLFKVGLGSVPLGDKEQSGDGKTPEGSFYICVKNPKSKFYLSLGFSYPNQDDAERGLAAGLIDRPTHDKILAAQKRRTTPPWNTALGGEIFIHGRGASSDWTLGCIALEDPDMKILFDLLDVGTTVIIKP